MQSNPESAAGCRETAAGRQALAAVLLQRQSRLWPRFLSNYARLSRLPRGWWRRIYRKAAVSLAGAALLLALSRAPAIHAANINVDGVNCTLIEAIQTANSDSAVPGCITGSGADTINLLTNVTLNTSYGFYYDSETGLPLITSTITIEGNGHTIERNTNADKFRLMAVSSSGDLTLNNVTISGGYAYGRYPYPYAPGYYEYYGNGGAVYNNGTLTITNSEISGNEALRSGGGVYSLSGGVTITDSTFSSNETRERQGGGLKVDQGTVTISKSTFSGNAADTGGGAIFNSAAVMTITNSLLTGNSANYQDGGAIYHDEGELTITHSTLSYNSAGGGVSSGSGGAIRAEEGEVIIANSLLFGNEAKTDAGAVSAINGIVTIQDSTIRDNSAGFEGGGIENHSADTLILRSTISNNSARVGGGLYHNDDEVRIVNSTFSGNTATEQGGAISNRGGDLFITNSTLTGNMAEVSGGGIHQDFDHSQLSLVRTLISGNSAPNESELYIYTNGTATGDQHNLFGHSGLTDDEAFHNFTPGATDIKATSDGTNVDLADILDITLAANGGPTETHALVSGSPAIDHAPNSDCTADPMDGVDQRGAPRNVDGDGSGSANECDVGAFERQGQHPLFFFSAETAGSAPGVGPFDKNDVLQFSDGTWSSLFDASAAGLTNAHNVYTIHVNSATDLYLSFFQNKVAVPGLGQVLGHDILRWNGSHFSRFFDGSDVGLTTVGEKLDGLEILDGSAAPTVFGGACDAYLLLSTFGTGRVPAFGGGVLNFRGEDVLGFCLTNSGANTAGFWHMVLDGSAEGMPKNVTFSLSAFPDGSLIYLTTKGTFNVDDATGGHSMVYRYAVATGEFSGPIFSAPVNGLNQRVDGLHVEGDLP